MAQTENNNQILFFCEASPQLGFGHVGRCMALASTLRDGYGQSCHFIFRGSESAKLRIEEDGYKVTMVDNFNDWNFSGESAVVLDIRRPLEDTFFTRARESNTLLCTLDDPTTNRMKCDIAFYPPVPQVINLGWKGYQGEIYCDWDFIPLRREFVRCVRRNENHVPQILITMGGSDPYGLTVRVLNALKKCPGNWQATVIAGLMCNDLDKITNIAVELGDSVEILNNVSNMAEIMARSDMAVAAFGMTAYELAACGVPQLLLCLNDDHARSASALHIAGAAVSLGRYDSISDEDLLDQVTNFISGNAGHPKMSRKASMLGIGHGAATIASIIMERLESAQ